MFRFRVWLWLVVSLASVHAGDERPKLQVLNGTDQPIEVFWLAPSGERVSQGGIAPGKHLMITTTLGHAFAVVGQDERRVVSQAMIQGVRYAPPHPQGIPACYTQQVNVRDYPIVATAKVNPYALKEAAWLAGRMLGHRPEVIDAMARSGARLCIMATDEFTTDLPEFERMKAKAPEGFEQISAEDYWDARARGLGGSETDPYCSCGVENLLDYPGDPYAAECIFIHEFAHNVHLRGMLNLDPTFDGRLKATYEDAMAKGLWKGKYAAVNDREYFAEGAQSWFDDNRENDHDHNHVNTRAELIAYDPGLAALCREVFGEVDFSYTKPTTRLHGHLEGYDPSTAPTFVWPKHLLAVKQAIRAQAQERERAAHAANGR